MQNILVGLTNPKRSLDIRSSSENEDSFTLENISHLRKKALFGSANLSVYQTNPPFLITFIYIYIYTYIAFKIFIYLAEPGLSFGIWDLVP